MKINAVNAQSFRAIYKNTEIDYTKEQTDVALDILKKAEKIDPKYDKTSLLGYLKADYNMDLFADPSSDKKTINLYISEVLPSTNEDCFKNKTKLTYVGSYNSKHPFETKDVEAELDRITGKSGTNLVNVIATAIAVLSLIFAPVLGVVMLIKDKSAPKIENVIKNTTDTLKNLPKDTLNLTKKIIK